MSDQESSSNEKPIDAIRPERATSFPSKIKPLRADIDLCQTMIDALSGTIKDPTIDVNAQILLSKELREWVALKHKIKE